jgi:hypothetical protein
LFPIILSALTYSIAELGASSQRQGVRPSFWGYPGRISVKAGQPHEVFTQCSSGDCKDRVFKESKPHTCCFFTPAMTFYRRQLSQRLM